MSKRIVIVSGGKLEETVCLPILEGQEEGYIIGVDRGVEFLYRHQIMPDYIVGDFDSVRKKWWTTTATRPMWGSGNTIR